MSYKEYASKEWVGEQIAPLLEGGNYQPADFVVTVDGSGIADKTWAEVQTARQEGRRIYLDRTGMRYEYSYEGYDFSEFLHFNGEVVYSAKLYDWHQTVEFASELVGGGDSNTVIFYKNNVTYDAVAEAFIANKAVYLVYAYNTITYFARCYKIGSQDAFFVGGIEATTSDTYIIHQVIVSNDSDPSANTITIHEIEVSTPYSVKRMIQDAPTAIMLVLAHTDTGYGIFVDGGEDAGGYIPVSYENLMPLITTKSLLILNEEDLAVYRLDKIDPITQAIVFSRTDGNIISTITMAADNTITVAESEVTYSKAQIDTALGSYITDIDNLIGGDS